MYCEHGTCAQIYNFVTELIAHEPTSPRGASSREGKLPRGRTGQLVPAAPAAARPRSMTPHRFAASERCAPVFGVSSRAPGSRHARHARLCAPDSPHLVRLSSTMYGVMTVHNRTRICPRGVASPLPLKKREDERAPHPHERDLGHRVRWA